MAGYDDAFMRWVLCRRRDENGGLIRSAPEGLPSWMNNYLDSRGHWIIRNPTSYASMFRQVKEQQGLDSQASSQEWRRWSQQQGYGG